MGSAAHGSIARFFPKSQAMPRLLICFHRLLSAHLAPCSCFIQYSYRSITIMNQDNVLSTASMFSSILPSKANSTLPLSIVTSQIIPCQALWHSSINSAHGTADRWLPSSLILHRTCHFPLISFAFLCHSIENMGVYFPLLSNVRGR